MKLFPYQAQDVRTLLKRKDHMILGLVPGLGKTIITVAYLFISKAYPALVICPSTIKENWRRELEKFDITNVKVLSGTKKERLSKKTDVYIINYDIIKNWNLQQIQWATIIADESQFLANPKTQRTKAFTAIAKSCKARRLFLSGTPYTSKTGSFYTTLNLVNPKDFHNRYQFLHHFCKPRFNGFGWVYDGLSNEKELHALVMKNMIRHTKEEVLKDLPPKLFTLVEMPLDKAAYKEYLHLEAEIKTLTPEELRTKWQGHYVDMKRAAYAAKEQATYQWIEEFLTTGEKLVVFCAHLSVFGNLMKKFEDTAVGICGNTKNRQKSIDEFQNNPKIKLFVGQINAAGVGITLTAASHVAFVEFGETASAHEQAADRCHRIGATASCINIYYLIAPGTIEKKIAKRLVAQNQYRQQILDEGEVKNLVFGDDFNLEVFKDYALRGNGGEIAIQWL